MKFLILSCLLSIFSGLTAQEVAFRSENDYTIKLDYEFKIKKEFDSDKFSFEKSSEDRVLPHLSVIVEILNSTEDEQRIKIVDNKRNVKFSGKLKGESVRFKMGFTDDMKLGRIANIFKIIILTKKKDPINQITLEVNKDGNFLINGVLSGKL